MPFQEGSFDWQPMIRLLNSKGADEIAKVRLVVGFLLVRRQSLAVCKVLDCAQILRAWSNSLVCFRRLLWAPSVQPMARHTCCAVQYGDLLMEQVAAAAAAAEAADSAAPAPAAEPDLLPALLGDVEVSDVLARLVRQAAARQLTHAPLEPCAPAWAAHP